MKGRTLPTHGVCGGADADEVRRHTPGPGGRVGNEDDSTSAWEFTMVHALMHLPQKQRGIQLVAVRVVEHPFDCPRAQLFDHVRQIVSRFGEVYSVTFGRAPVSRSMTPLSSRCRRRATRSDREMRGNPRWSSL